jgi:hypothetical protein
MMLAFGLGIRNELRKVNIFISILLLSLICLYVLSTIDNR